MSAERGEWSNEKSLEQVEGTYVLAILPPSSPFGQAPRIPAIPSTGSREEASPPPGSGALCGPPDRDASVAIGKVLLQLMDARTFVRNHDGIKTGYTKHLLLSDRIRALILALRECEAAIRPLQRVFGKGT